MSFQLQNIDLDKNVSRFIPFKRVYILFSLLDDRGRIHWFSIHNISNTYYNKSTTIQMKEGRKWGMHPLQKKSDQKFFDFSTFVSMVKTYTLHHKRCKCYSFLSFVLCKLFFFLVWFQYEIHSHNVPYCGLFCWHHYNTYSMQQMWLQCTLDVELNCNF